MSMNIMGKECLLKWPDQEDAVATLEARVTARWREGETKGTGHGYFVLVKGRVPSMHEVRNTRLKLHITDRTGTKYVADVMISLLQPIERPGTEVDIKIDSIEQVE
jgi:hypothetical protein